MADEKTPPVNNSADNSAPDPLAKGASKKDKSLGKAANQAADQEVDKVADQAIAKSGAEKQKPPADKAPAGKAPAAKKKEKPPALEEKPFNEFMEQHYLPALKEAMAKEGIDNLTLEFAKRKIEVMGQNDADPYWQVQGEWEEATEGQHRFNIAFIDENISGQKVFTFAANGSKPSTIEQFMGDERRVTLDLMVLYTLQRLNGQKWLTRN